jgi:hypothetical protein
VSLLELYCIGNLRAREQSRREKKKALCGCVLGECDGEATAFGEKIVGLEKRSMGRGDRALVHMLYVVGEDLVVPI